MKVLVATDGSRDANDAVEWLAHFPLPSDATMEVVSVISAPFFDESALRSPWTELRSQTECVVEDTRARLAKQWPAAIGRILHGDPRAAIVGSATEGTADLIGSSWVSCRCRTRSLCGSSAWSSPCATRRRRPAS